MTPRGRHSMSESGVLASLQLEYPQGAQTIQGVIAVSNSWDVHTALCIASPLLSTQVPGKLTASRDGVLGRWGPHENQLSLE